MNTTLILGSYQTRIYNLQSALIDRLAVLATYITQSALLSYIVHLRLLFAI